MAGERDQQFDASMDEREREQLQSILGLGRFSARKSYYPELQRKIEELREERNWAQNYLDIAGVMFVALNEDGDVTLANRKATEILGYEQTEIVGQNWFDRFVPERLRDQVREVFESLKTSDSATAEYYENVVLTRSGEERIVAWHNTPLRDDRGHLIGTLSSGQDITERSRAQEELAETRALLMAAIEASPAGILIADAPDVRVRLANSASLAIRGLPAHELVDIPVSQHAARWQTFHPDGTPFPPKELPLSRAVLQGETSRNVEAIIRRPDGQERHVLATAAPVRNRDGEIVAGVVVFNDVTDYRAAELRLRQLEIQIAHATRLSMAGEMVAGIVHEIGQPLYAITNFAKACRELLLSRPEEVATLREWNAEIAEAADRAGAIVGRLRDFLRRTEPRPSELAVNELVNETVDLVRFETRAHQARVRLRLQEPSPRLQADRVQIQQVLLNLLRNGLEALDSRAAHQRGLTVGTAVRNGSVEVFVADTGPGLPAEHEVDIFESFATTKPEGMGMGLAISRRIVQAHGGQLWAENNPNGGATFRFTLPLPGEKGE